jgi:hypothetical protein
VFENRVLRRIFGPKREEVESGWRRLHNEGHNNLYASPNTIRVIKSRRMGVTGHIARMDVDEKCTQNLFGMPRRWWDDNITMKLTEIG